MALSAAQMIYSHRIAEAVAAERERCALIAENYPIVAPSSDFVVQTTMEVAAESIASSIRASVKTTYRKVP
jgi:hypothetical protein